MDGDAGRPWARENGSMNLTRRRILASQPAGRPLAAVGSGRRPKRSCSGPTKCVGLASSGVPTPAGRERLQMADRRRPRTAAS